VSAWIVVAGVAAIAISCVPIFVAIIRRRHALELTLKLLAGEGEGETSSRLNASATCAAIVGEISAKALPRSVEELAPPVPGPPQIRPKDDHGRLSLAYGQVLDLLQRVSALESFAGRVNPQSTGSNAPERDVFVELVRQAGPPSAVLAGAADVYKVMRESDVALGASGQTRTLTTWVIHELDSCAPGKISLEASAANLERVLTEDGWGPVMTALRGWIDSPGVYEVDRAELESLMRALGLTADQSTLTGIRHYEKAIADYPEQDRLLIESFATSVCSGLEEAWTRFQSSLPDGPALSAEQHRDLQGIEQELRTSAQAYLEHCRSLLETAQDGPKAFDGSAGYREAITHRLAEAQDLMTAFDRQIEDGSVLRAGMSLAAIPLPVVPGWKPAEPYRLARERLADGLRGAAAQLCQGISTWMAAASESLRSCSAEVRQRVSDQIDLIEHERADRWEQVLSAARALQYEVARGLLARSTGDDPTTPVRASIAVGVIDGAATGNVDTLIHELIPVSHDAGGSSEVADQLMAAEALERRYQTLAAVLAGADGILIGALAADGLGGFSQPILGLAGIARELYAASSDLFAYLHSPDFGNQLHLAGSEFVKNAIGQLEPSTSDISVHTDSLAHLVSSLHESYSNVTGTFLVELYKADGEVGLAAGKYLLGDATHVGKQLASHSLHSPSIEEALRHTEHAGQLVGMEVVHGVIAHVPIATGVLATVREMRLRREHEISVQSTVGNIALDTVTVGAGAGIGAALAATAPFHLGPHAIVTIPATALGAILFRKELTKARLRRLEEMKKEVEFAHANFISARARIVTDFSDSLVGEMTIARTDFLGKVRAHPASVLNQKNKVEHLAVTLHSAATEYVDRLQMLTREIQNTPVGPGTGAPDISALNAVTRRVQHATAKAQSFLRANDLTGALLLLSAAPLPECRAWGPSGRYRQAYADVARNLTELEDAHRADVKKWIDHSLGTFAGTKRALDQWLIDANADLKAKWATALAPFEAAQKTFNVELARLGGH
jgi:hypothetical protein